MHSAAPHPSRRFLPFVLISLSGVAIGAAGDPAAPAPAVSLPDTIVTAQKQPENAQDVPFTVKPFTQTMIEDGGFNVIRDAVLEAPNLFTTEFTARKLTNTRVRGIGGGPYNPAVTTYYDGVPQLNNNTASRQFIDVGQIELLSGGQSTLYGRNSIGGVININSGRPSDHWTAGVRGSYGNYDYRDARLYLSGPIVDKQAYFSIAGGYQARDGYTTNSVTGNDLDDREAEFGKGQLLFVGEEGWELRLILAGEHAHDGAYALEDLDSARATPHKSQVNFEGYTYRDIVSPTIILTRTGQGVDFASVTGFVFWDTQDATDLDYGPADSARRMNNETATQFTQEFRVSSSEGHDLRLNDDARFRWQAGLFIFQQNYDQDAANIIVPLVTTLPQSAHFDDAGVGAWGQGTLILWDKLDLTAGVRVDYEHKDAVTSQAILFGPTVTLDDSASFVDVSPRFAVAYHLSRDIMPYATVSKGFKAGGFNAVHPAGTGQGYGEESSWTYEAGVKSEWFEDRLIVNFAAFYIDWSDIQLNMPAGGGQFFVDNVGNAVSRGVELQTTARVMPGLDVFANLGYMDTQFLQGSMDGGVSIAGNELPYAPDFTVNVGAQAHEAFFRGLSVYARAEVTAYGSYAFDDSNAQSQSAFSLASFRLGVRGDGWFIEGWINNAFDTHYIQVAFPFPGFGLPSGYVAEAGDPRTCGITAGVRF